MKKTTAPLTTYRPFLKWVGGKYRLIPQICAKLPSGTIFIEPFVGGGAIFLNTDFPTYLLNDINPDLISLFEIVKREPATFIAHARTFFVPRYNTESAYYRLRKRFNRLPLGLERAALFLFLNRHSYNGLCRYNASGHFNAPFGDYRQPYFPEKELETFSMKAQQAEFRNDSFETILDQAPTGSVIYCDPPYVPLSATASFTGYSSRGFTLDNHHMLTEAAQRAADRGCTVLISNHDTPLTRKLYRQAKCTRIQVQRNISCQARGTVAEVLAIFSPSAIARDLKRQ